MVLAYGRLAYNLAFLRRATRRLAFKVECNSLADHRGDRYSSFSRKNLELSHVVILDQDIGTFHMHLYTPIGAPPSNLKISELQRQRGTGKLQRHYLARVVPTDVQP